MCINYLRLQSFSLDEQQYFYRSQTFVRKIFAKGLVIHVWQTCKASGRLAIMEFGPIFTASKSCPNPAYKHMWTLPYWRLRMTYIFIRCRVKFFTRLHRESLRLSQLADGSMIPRWREWDDYAARLMSKQIQHVLHSNWFLTAHFWHSTIENWRNLQSQQKTLILMPY